ncbi:MAG: class II fumarate hydratase [Acidobacteriota bacterium]|nr:MAG: class II fumarate hydratase [Acidobacteriota bacterium]
MKRRKISSPKTRIEKDALGPVKVPAHAYHGAQTQRAAENFPISGWRLSGGFVRALGLIKKAAAETNLSLGLLDRRRAAAIIASAREVAEGRFDDEFVVDVFQTGSGTSTNMNANEVIANRAIERLGGKRGSKKPVHPNDHVNKGQSSNDVIPTALHLAALVDLEKFLYPSLKILRKSLERKAKKFDSVVKLGRTHLQDAVPVRLGQEFSGYAAQIELAEEGVRKASDRLRGLPIGGTAVGTGVNTHPAFAKGVCARLSKATKLKLHEARNHFEAQAARDGAVELSGALKVLACALMKVANDIRWMASGPHGGLGEITLPDLQPGSSIMPGKVNPVMCEAVTQVAAQVVGADTAVTVGGATGNFELNVMIPVMAHNLLESIRISGNVSKIFAERCVDGIKVRPARCRALAERSGALVTALVPHLGYDLAAQIGLESGRTGRTVREIVKERGLLSDRELDKALELRKMTEPTRPRSKRRVKR